MSQDSIEIKISEDTSRTLLTILIVVVVGVVLALGGYYVVSSTYQARLEERESSRLLYDEMQSPDLFEDQITILPTLQIGAAAANNMSSQENGVAKGSDVQRFIPPTRTQTKPSRSRVPSPAKKSSPTPTLSDGIFRDPRGTLRVERSGWRLIGEIKESGETYTAVTNPSGSYTMRLLSADRSSTVLEYIASRPRDLVAEATASATLTGLDAVRVKPHPYTRNQTQYLSTGIYARSADKNSIYAIGLDTTNLDVNNADLTSTFDQIIQSARIVTPITTPTP